MTEPSISGTVDGEQLDERIDNRVNEWVDDRIDETIADLDIEGRINDALAELDIDEEVEIDYDRVADEVAKRIDIPDPGDGTGGSGGSGGSAGGELSRLRLAYDPEKTGTLASEGPTGEMHGSTGWGPVYRVEESCVVRSTTIDAQSRQTETFRIWELDGDDVDAGVADDPYRERRIEAFGGIQEVGLDIVLEPGVYFFERADTEQAGPLRRPPDANPEEINDTDAPVEWLRGWHPDYRPSVDKDAYDRYVENDWASAYHYLHELEIGYMSDGDSGATVEQGGG